MPAEDTEFGEFPRDPQSIDHIARRVAELLRGQVVESRGFQLIDTETVARTMSVSEDWVRAHAAELGAIRIGDGTKGALRFEVTRIRAALSKRRVGPLPSGEPSRSTGRRRSSAARSEIIPDDVREW